MAALKLIEIMEEEKFKMARKTKSISEKNQKGRILRKLRKKEEFWSQLGRGYCFLAVTSGGFGAEVGPMARASERPGRQKL
jgi:hypothetical protein